MKEIIIDGNENFGMNYYHESMGYATWSEADLIRIKKVTNKIKLFKHPWGNNARILAICQKCKELGFYVVLGENFDGNKYAPPYDGSPMAPKLLTEENWITYCNYVKTDYTKVKDYVDEFLVSNEIDIHTDKTAGMKGQNLVNKVAALKEELKLIQNCKFGIQEGSWKYLYLGINPPYDYSAFDTLYFTIYSDDETKFREVATKMRGYYPQGMFGEWNVGFDIESITSEELTIKSDKIKNRKDWLKAQGIPGYIFTYGHDKYHKIIDNIQYKKLSKLIHYCDHDEGNGKRGCQIIYDKST